MLESNRRGEQVARVGMCYWGGPLLGVSSVESGVWIGYTYCARADDRTSVCHKRKDGLFAMTTGVMRGKLTRGSHLLPRKSQG